VISPYKGVPQARWASVTSGLIAKHPLKVSEIVEIVLTAWNAVMSSAFGPHRFRIGVDIFPKPQFMGFLLHELIALELRARYAGVWRGEQNASDKDCVFIPDDSFSIEIKTSSHKDRIFGNRSYAQQSTKGKKAKAGYYLAVNFQDCRKQARPQVQMIRFGWLDSTDWVGQASQTGQQSSLPPALERAKLLQLFP
jgi:hypothetical protein